jgi:isopenicillin N synthase-like dioxygenase
MVVATTFLLPVIDLQAFISDPNSSAAEEECKRLAEACTVYGAFAIRDNRVTEEANSQFLDLMEDYFDQETFIKQKDCRPELSYQVGATPALTELPRCGRDHDCQDMVNSMEQHNKPAAFDQPDPKWRFVSITCNGINLMVI